MENKILLSFCIPTYNRAEILRESLEDIMPKIEGLPIEVIVIDNASTDNTPEIAREYPRVKYYRNDTNIGGDMNILKSYKVASVTSDYICVLGDSYRIQGDIQQFIGILQKNEYDLVVIGRGVLTHRPRFKTGEFSDPNKVLAELGGFMDLTGSIVIKHEAIIEKNYVDYLWSNFIHLAIAFNHIRSIESPKCFFFNEFYTQHTTLNKVGTSWYGKSIDIFSKTWFMVIISLPGYDVDAKLKCISEHDKIAPIFNIHALIFLREHGLLSVSQIKRNKNFLPFVTETPYWVFRSIAFTPKWICRSIHKLASMIRSLIGLTGISIAKI